MNVTYSDGPMNVTHGNGGTRGLFSNTAMMTQPSITKDDLVRTTDNSSDDAPYLFYGIAPDVSSNILNGLAIFSAITLLINGVILVASKFVTGGKSSTLIFIRSLCLADVLIGMFGIFKSLLLKNLDTRVINCFLPESIFISASTAIILTLFWLNIDSYLRLTKPLGGIISMDKHNVIIAMTILWNAACIIGFLPQMAWDDDKFECNLFQYYKISYVTCVSTLWMLGILGCCATQVLLNHTSRQVRLNKCFLSPKSLEFQKFLQLNATIRNDITILTMCYVPLLAYLFLFYVNNRHKEHNMANVDLIFFLPIYVLRSFASAFLHSYRAMRMQPVMHEISQKMSMSLCKRCSRFSSDSSSDNHDVFCRMRMSSTGNLITNSSYMGTSTPPARSSISTPPPTPAFSTPPARHSISMPPESSNVSTPPPTPAFSTPPARRSISMAMARSSTSSPPARPAFSTPPARHSIITPPARSSFSTPRARPALSSPPTRRSFSPPPSIADFSTSPARPSFQPRTASPLTIKNTSFNIIKEEEALEMKPQGKIS